MNELQKFILNKGLENITVEELKQAIKQDYTLTQFERASLFNLIDICSAYKTANDFLRQEITDEKNYCCLLRGWDSLVYKGPLVALMILLRHIQVNSINFQIAWNVSYIASMLFNHIDQHIDANLSEAKNR